MTGECPDPGGGWASRRTNPVLLLRPQVVGRLALQDGEAGSHVTGWFPKSNGPP